MNLDNAEATSSQFSDTDDRDIDIADQVHIVTSQTYIKGNSVICASRVN